MKNNHRGNTIEMENLNCFSPHDNRDSLVYHVRQIAPNQEHIFYELLLNCVYNERLQKKKKFD